MLGLLWAAVAWLQANPLLLVALGMLAYRLYQSRQPFPEIEGSRVRTLHSLRDFNAAHAENPDRAVLVDFYATWCPPCRKAAPAFAQMSMKHDDKTILFCKVDVDKASDVAQECGISAMPTFKLFKGGKEVDSVRGWSQAGVEAMIAKAGAHGQPKKSE